jgi:hypothetical protein
LCFSASLRPFLTLGTLSLTLSTFTLFTTTLQRLLNP